MILVAGATGRLGGAIARDLLAQGQRVRVLVRNEAAQEAFHDRGAEVALGDLRDPTSLATACHGADVVITTANSARRSGEDTVDAVDLNGTGYLIDAAAAAGVRHFIYTSVLGADEQHPAPFLAAKGRNNARLRASGLAWTILAPNAFQESWPAVVVGAPALQGHAVTIVGEGRRRHTFVAEPDVAAFALAALVSPAALNRLIPIGGPEALSWRDVVGVYERVLGRRLDVRFVPPGEPVPGIPPVVLPFLAGLDTFDSVFDTKSVADEFGVQLTPLEQIARTQAAAAGA